MEKAGATARREWIFEGPFGAETGRAGMTRLLEGYERPTAVCCASDEIAFGAIHAARLAGVRCPQDISIIGGENEGISTIQNPPLTTIQEPLREMAERAAAMFDQLTSGERVPARHTILPVKLIERDSVA